MGLRTYLTALNEPVICPGYRHDYSFDFKTQTIAETAYQIPLIWLGMFRISDLFLRLGLSASEKEQIAHARLLPGSPDHHSVWHVS